MSTSNPVVGAVFVLAMILVLGVGGAVISRTYRPGQTQWAMILGAALAVLLVLLAAGFVAAQR